MTVNIMTTAFAALAAKVGCRCGSLRGDILGRITRNNGGVLCGRDIRGVQRDRSCDLGIAAGAGGFGLRGLGIGGALFTADGRLLVGFHRVGVHGHATERPLLGAAGAGNHGPLANGF